MSKTKKKPEAAPPEKQVTLSVPESLVEKIDKAMAVYADLERKNKDLVFYFKQWQSGLDLINDVYASANNAKIAREDTGMAAMSLLKTIYEEVSKGTVSIVKEEK